VLWIRDLSSRIRFWDMEIVLDGFLGMYVVRGGSGLCGLDDFCSDTKSQAQKMNRYCSSAIVRLRSSCFRSWRGKRSLNRIETRLVVTIPTVFCTTKVHNSKY
jgi:hypothetical protein